MLLWLLCASKTITNNFQITYPLKSLSSLSHSIKLQHIVWENINRSFNLISLCVCVCVAVLRRNNDATATRQFIYLYEIYWKHFPVCTFFFLGSGPFLGGNFCVTPSHPFSRTTKINSGIVYVLNLNFLENNIRVVLFWKTIVYPVHCGGGVAFFKQDMKIQKIILFPNIHTMVVFIISYT